MNQNTVAFYFFPYRFDRSTAPEAADPNTARIMHNIRQGPWEGRLRRRLGLCPTNVDSTGTSASNIIRCKAMVRDDGATMLFDITSSGSLRVTVGAAPSYSETDYFGSRSSQTWREHFQEDGFLS